MTGYPSFNDLFLREREGRDYRIRLREGSTPYCVMAPHGGGIEPGTSEIADAIANAEHGFYAFEGLKDKGNAVLHLASVSMDEPEARRLAGISRTVITVHGCRDEEPVVYIGGLDVVLIGRIRDSLRREDFLAVSPHPNPELRGVHPNNLCNLCQTGKGVQLEIAGGLRRQMFPELTRQGRENPTKVFCRFVEAIRQVLR